MNFVIEKYDTALKEARVDLDKSNKMVAAKGRLFRRKRAEWQDEYEKMAEKRERAIARRKIQRERADAAEAELSVARSTIAALERQKANLKEEMGVKAEEHEAELDRLRESRIFEVTKERVKVETVMVSKCNKHFGFLRDWWVRYGPFYRVRLL